MDCKHCGKEIPDDTVVCPRCGGRQTPYTEKRKPPAPSKRRRRAQRTSILSLVFVGACVALILILQPIFENNDKQTRLAELESAYNDFLLGNGSLDTVYNYANHLYNKYPDSEEAHQALAIYCKSIGIDIADIPPEALSEGDFETIESAIKADEEVQERLRQQLIDTAHSSIIQVDRVQIDGPDRRDGFDITINWKNMSEKTVTSIFFYVEAFDSAGNPAPCREREDATAKLTPSADRTFPKTTEENPFYTSLFMDVFVNPDIKSCYLTRISIYYQDGSSVFLDSEIIPLVLDPSGYYYSSEGVEQV